ncbi:MAG: DUF2442 domain-containing protein [Acidaminococcaceae bacterium]|nr:DUF2442 domain-containing protein [Acidaminococcaceae bacterium]
MLKVNEAKALPNYRILVMFDTGEKKIFDMSKMLNYPVYQKLKDETVFKALIIRRGVVTWDDGNIDIAPEYMYDHNQEEVPKN